MGSFKVKLVAYFLLLSLLPLAAAFWGFSTVASRSETRRVDALLQAGLRASLAGYQDELRAADREAAALSRNPAFQRALMKRDRAALERLLLGHRRLTVIAGDLRVGARVPLAATREVAVVGPAGSRGLVIASVPLNRALVGRLERRSGLEESDHVVLLQNGRIVAGPIGISGRLQTPSGRPTTVKLAGTRYRALAAGTLQEQPSATLAVISPQSKIDASNWAAQRRLVLGLLASLAIVMLVAYVEGRAIVRAIGRLVDAARAIARGDLEQRVPVQGRDELAQLGRAFNDMAFQLQTRLHELDEERARLREAIDRFGEALAATHDPEQLRRVLVETAVEATGAAGGVVVGTNNELVKVGSPDEGRERIEQPLLAGQVSYGSMMLFADEFSEEDRMTAASLASQAVVALEAARLHRIISNQALVDGLTGLANRRSCEETLASELARAERFPGPLALIVADLDDFKEVNDRHGHQAGDNVLREFAALLSESVRDIDLACRWGGEEFLLVLPGTDLEGGARVAERVRRALQERLVLSVDGDPIHVTASFGVAAYPQSRTAAELFAAADGALYEAKRTGKNRVSTGTATVARTENRTPVGAPAVEEPSQGLQSAAEAPPQSPTSRRPHAG
jgi:diguanylate cyclase (GGDEF)-like protein